MPARPSAVEAQGEAVDLFDGLLPVRQMMRWKLVANVCARGLMVFLVAAFAMPVIESLILKKTVEEIVPHWNIHLAIWGPTSILIGVVAELAWRRHVRKLARKREDHLREQPEGTSDT